MVGWTTQRCMFLLFYVVFYETLLLIVSTFNNLILLSTISRIYFLSFYQFAYNYFMFRYVLFGLQLFYVISVLFGCKYREGTKTILPYQCNRALWDLSLETLETFISVNYFSIINPSLLSQISFIASFLSHISILLQTTIERRILTEQGRRVSGSI